MGQWAAIFYLTLPILLILLVLSRSRKQQRQIVAVQDQVAIGTTVMMTSGIYGEVVGVGDDGTIELEVAPGVRTRWTRQAVARVVTPDVPDQIDPDHTIELPDHAQDPSRPNQADSG